MPSALSVPICEPTACRGACITRTRVERKAKQTIIATPRVMATFTMVHRKSSRCSRNGLEVSLSGKSRNLKMSRSAIGQKFGRCGHQKRREDAHALLKLTRNGGSRSRWFRAKRLGSARRLRIALISARKKTARQYPRPQAKRIGIANFVLRDHAANLLYGKLAAIENRFRFISIRRLLTSLHRPRQKKVAALIGESR